MPSLVPCVLYLDCEILLGLFGWLCKGLSLIDAVLLKEVDDFEQIFISTHNLEFLK
jgi:hypothetical protein